MDGDVREILERYKGKLEDGSLDFESSSIGSRGSGVMSREYDIFRREMLEKRVSNYEKWCNVAERILRVRASEKEREGLLKSIETSHLNISPEGATSFAALVSVLVILFGIMIGVLSYAFGELWLITPLFFVLAGAVMIKPLTHIPNYIANRWRLEASNQMVLCILYVVMYMRHTSNLEHAIRFAGEHIGGALSLDLKKVFWNVETGKFFSIKESLDNYLEGWRGCSMEFIESFHLIEGSLYEINENKRVEMLEKSLQVMLEGTYEKMLHYAHNLQSPITVLHMLGIILPVLGLVIFPLIGSFLSGLIKWYHLAILYDIILPVFVFFMGNNLLNKRPTGYGESDVRRDMNVEEYKENFFGADPKFAGILIGALIVMIGLVPMFVYFFAPGFDFEFFGGKFFDYKDGNGPYGIGALMFSLLIPIGLAVGFFINYYFKTRKLIFVRKRTDNLEKEFSGAIFQLGNRIGDGVPAEVAFGSVTESMRGTEAGDFFFFFNENIRRLGMSIKEAIFNEKVGAILYFPSKLIESSMKVLVESSRKGPGTVSRSLITISNYVDRIRQVNERLKDLMAEVLSSMTSQINFLTPVIAGIVVGVGSMVVTIINKLGEQFSQVSVQGFDAGGIAGIAKILRIEDVIPGFQFQSIVGIYLVEITIILTILATGIERGVDRVSNRNKIAKNLIRAVGLYVVIAFVGIIVFNLLANAVSFSVAS